LSSIFGPQEMEDNVVWGTPLVLFFHWWWGCRLQSFSIFYAWYSSCPYDI